MPEQPLTTLERIHQAAIAEFREKGFAAASLRRIVASLGMTTGAFYGYYPSKEALYEALVGPPYDYLLGRFQRAQRSFAELPRELQPAALADCSRDCMFDMLHYAYDHLEECQLLLCGSEGTRFAGLVDRMVEIEVTATHDYMAVLGELGRPVPHLDPRLEHILITGMFHTFFELILHAMPLEEAETYLREMRAFYTAGWMKIMGQPAP